MENELYSHIILIPLISLYLIWQERSKLPAVTGPFRRCALVLATLGVAMLALLGLGLRSGNLPPENHLALTTLSMLFLLGAICAWFLGRARFRAVLFPLAFLLFMVPLPAEFLSSIETLLQYGSAFVARGFFAVAGTTVYVAGLTFQLPGITIEVAPECSGIHSTMALLITSVLAGYFFLRSPSRRTVLALAVIPLALLRNGLRVFVIGELCVRIGPEMIDSYIHRQGGPIFFVFSLIPFFFLLFWLARSERRKPGPK
ncbi:MAG: exosortase VPDSG-CTERM-specific [Verrucomicrobia bacterium]|nr:exosortase VPDSG-CTERM-specific [Verrucomicrobiota bacterium]